MNDAAKSLSSKAARFLLRGLLFLTISCTLCLPAAADLIEVAPGAVDDVTDGVCSLLEAVANAEQDDTGQVDCSTGNGPDIIRLAPDSVYTLTQATGAGHGVPSITTDITIEGQGSTLRRSFAGGTPAFRLLRVNPGARLVVKNLSLVNGLASGLPGVQTGGAILSSGTLEIEDCDFGLNRAIGDALGGAIMSSAGSVNLLRTRFQQNSTDAASPSRGGGAVMIQNADLIVEECAFIGNTADANPGDANGGAGGAIYLQATTDDGTPDPDVSALIRNTTFSGNTAEVGGAIYVQSPTTGADVVLTLDFVTMVSNDSFDGDEGDGIFMDVVAGSPSVVLYQNSILHSNGEDSGGGTIVGTDCHIEDSGGFTSGGGNLLDPTDNCPIDPEDRTVLDLAPHLDLELNVDHHVPIEGGLAVDHGTFGCVPGVTRDQLGRLRGNGLFQGDDTCDAGAIESLPIFGDDFETGNLTRWSSTVP